MTGVEGEWRFSSTHSQPRHQMRGAWLTPRSDHFAPETEPRDPLQRRLDGPQSRSWRVGEEKIPWLHGVLPRTLQPVTSCFTDYPTPAPLPWYKVMRINCRKESERVWRNLLARTALYQPLTLILLTWRIWWAPNNASKWQMGFNWRLEG
jgi:hypothetical protein